MTTFGIIGVKVWIYRGEILDPNASMARGTTTDPMNEVKVERGAPQVIAAPRQNDPRTIVKANEIKRRINEVNEVIIVMLMPKKVKHRRVMKGRMRGKATRGEKLSFGDFGLKTLEAAWITDRQIEAARIAMTRHVKRGGKIWIRIFPDKPITKKPAETRMGSGKGAPDHWVAVVKPGRVLYEIQGVDEALAREAMKLAAQKLPIKTKFVTRADLEGGIV